MNSARPRVLRELPLGTRIHDPTLLVNETSSEVHHFINRDMSDRDAPLKVILRPDQYFDFPHMNYHAYRADAPGEPVHITMKKGRTRETWLKRIPRRYSEGATESMQ